MKVKELIEFLKKQNQDALVLLSSDEEGNHFSPLDIENCGYASGVLEEELISYAFDSLSKEEMHGPYIILYPR